MSKNEEFALKPRNYVCENEELCDEPEEFCILNDEFCSETEWMADMQVRNTMISIEKR